MDKKNKLIQSILEEGDYSQWKKALKEDCVAQALKEREGSKKLINHLLMDGDYSFFRKRLQENCIKDLGFKPSKSRTWRKSAAILGAAAALVALLFMGNQLQIKPQDSQIKPGFLVASKPLKSWQIVKPRKSLCVVETNRAKMVSIELRTRKMKNIISSKNNTPMVKKITDKELLTMFANFPCGIVKTGENNKKFFLFKKNKEREKLRFY